MWDPISIFFCAWVLNIGLPEARLNVADVMEAREQRIIVEHINNSITIREGT
jgi:hypothetical protein